MRDHPAQLIASLTGSHIRETLPGGMSRELLLEAGSVRWIEKGRYSEENLSDGGYEEITIELSTRKRRPQLGMIKEVFGVYLVSIIREHQRD